MHGNMNLKIFQTFSILPDFRPKLCIRILSLPYGTYVLTTISDLILSSSQLV